VPGLQDLLSSEEREPKLFLFPSSLSARRLSAKHPRQFLMFIRLPAGLRLLPANCFTSDQSSIHLLSCARLLGF
jgi:hypothetical protein